MVEILNFKYNISLSQLYIMLARVDMCAKQYGTEAVGKALPKRKYVSAVLKG